MIRRRIPQAASRWLGKGGAKKFRGGGRRAGRPNAGKEYAQETTENYLSEIKQGNAASLHKEAHKRNDVELNYGYPAARQAAG